MSKRRVFNSAFKKKVALEALRGESTLSQLASKYGVHQSQVTQWKKQAIDGLSEVFSDKASKKKSHEQEVKELHAKIGEQFMLTPYYGSRQMMRHLRNEGYLVSRKRILRLMREMGIQAIYQKPRTSVANREHRTYPYLLKELAINRPNQVWCSDITYIPNQPFFGILLRENLLPILLEYGGHFDNWPSLKPQLRHPHIFPSAPPRLRSFCQRQNVASTRFIELNA